SKQKPDHYVIAYVIALHNRIPLIGMSPQVLSQRGRQVNLSHRNVRRPPRGEGGAAVGETQEEPYRHSFNGRLKVAFQRSLVTSGGGLLLVLELERLGSGAHRTAPRRRAREEHPVAAQ